ncbi:hypothetical protein [uncultured Eubacterium sp.]|uniref:hypothetical protein n=1 Tax=uncultured Eubacterium sp. TaxID=165185 RepID=UPI0026DC44CE|nr:hypothetical protein [uncultured Eubacterium sp.]
MKEKKEINMVVIKKDYLIKILNKIKKGIRGYTPIIISIISLFFSVKSYTWNEVHSELNYYIKPNVTETNNDKMNIELEFMVNNGAIGDIRVLDYRMGKLKEIANNRGGVIKGNANKEERTIELSVSFTEEKYQEVTVTFYILTEGKDGSRELDMIMGNVDFMNKRGEIRYYTTLDMVISEHNSDNVKNQNALKDYRELYDLLKKENEL